VCEYRKDFVKTAEKLWKVEADKYYRQARLIMIFSHVGTSPENKDTPIAGYFIGTTVKFCTSVTRVNNVLFCFVFFFLFLFFRGRFTSCVELRL
jgi:hypothetical protein